MSAAVAPAAPVQVAGAAPAKPDSDSDDERDNMPLSRVFAAAKPAAKPAAEAKSASSSSSSSSSSSATPKRKRAEPKPKPEKKEKAAPKRSAAAAAAAAMRDNEEEIESEDEKPKKRASKAKPKGKRGKKAADSDDEEEGDDDDEDGGDDDDDGDDEEPKAKRSKKDKAPSEEERKRNSDLIRPCDEYEMLSEVEPLKPTEGANKWWNRDAKKVKWDTLLHNGILFPPPYEPHSVKLKYDGKEVDLNAEEEEIATFYAEMLNTEHVKNPQFNKNFFRDWTKVLKKSGKDKTIKDLDKVDFRPIFDHVQKARDEKKVAKKEPAARKKAKLEKDLLNSIYGFAIVDGFQEKVANYKVEPPGLFRGRGAHPKTGTVKRRIRPEDVTINIGRGVKIPKAPDGHKWKGILHNQGVTWLAFYNDTFGDFKYIWLAASSRFKGQSDLQKYEKARKLKDKINAIRDNYNAEMKHKNVAFRQRATAIYLIDVLALRVGNEKDKSEVADTVGCCSLRVEHVTFTDEGLKVKFDFLGKDSMRYENEVTVNEIVFRNLKEFCAGKKKDDEIFDRLTTTSLNEHLKTLMPGLTAKVFRTFNASVTLEKELKQNEREIKTSDSVNDKILFYNKANREVAILCNHQRSVPKAFEGQLQKLLDKQKEVEDQKEELLEHIAYITKKTKVKPKPRPPVKKEKKEDNKDEKGAKKGDDDDDDEPKVIKLPDDPDRANNLLARLNKRLDDYRTKISLKQDTKTVALGTSKINYMDPRITVAWCKAKHVPIEKIFNKSLLSKFPWAMEVPSKWSF